MLNLTSFLKLLKESFRDLLPIILVILFFQLAIIQTVPDNWLSTTIGLTIVGVGLAVFLLGLEVGIFPVGEGLARDFAHKGSTKWIILFAFMIGFGTTVAEPALVVIAEKAAEAAAEAAAKAAEEAKAAAEAAAKAAEEAAKAAEASEETAE